MCDWAPTNRLTRIDWLLERDNPGVRYLTLTDLLGVPADDPDVLAAHQAVMQSGPVPAILAKQRPGGYWETAENFYVYSKYRGTVWSFILLAQLGADGSDPRVRAVGDFLIEHAQDPASGAFAYRSGTDGRGNPQCAIPCLTANLAWSLARLGRLDDPPAWRALEWLAESLRFDDGDTRPPKQRPYTVSDKCWGRHTCTVAVAKGLKALAEVPEGRRTAAMQTAIERGSEFLLKHHLFKRSHDLSQVVRPEWTRLGYPLMANTDVLEMLGVLARLGCRDGRMQEAIDLVLSKQDRQGRWSLESTYNGRMQARVERLGQPSKWVTLQAVKAMGSG